MSSSVKTKLEIRNQKPEVDPSSFWFLVSGLLLRRLRSGGRFRRSHIHRPPEPRALGDDNLRRLDVPVDGGAGHELDAIFGGDVARELPLHRHVLRMHGGLDARLRADPKLAAEIDLAANHPLDQDWFRAGDRPVDGYVRTEKCTVV